MKDRYDVRPLKGDTHLIGIYDQMRNDYCRLNGELLVWRSSEGAQRWLVQCFRYWRHHPEDAPSGWEPSITNTLTQLWTMPRSRR